jgi:uncharacterized protein
MVFDWPAHPEFLDRSVELQRLDDWYRSGSREPLALYGRRRVGKSWLMRRFAHGKRAVVLVGEHLSGGALLSRFAEQLAPFAGGLPLAIDDLPGLFRTLYALARDQELLAVIDEFPWMLPATQAGREGALSAIAAVMEDNRDASRLRLVLSGSSIGVMEGLFSERNPMHGRLERLELRPLPFGEARLFLHDPDPISSFARFSVAGGMPRYLRLLGQEGQLRDLVCRYVLSPNGPLWDEVRITVGQELRTPDVYFAILAQLSGSPKNLGELSSAARLDSTQASAYLASLMELRIVSRHVPVGADPRSSRNGVYRLDDPFVRFWFRYLFPFQAELEAGLSPVAVFDVEIAPTLAEHISVEYEAWCRIWVRHTFGDRATKVGSWWGNAANQYRRTGERTSEEIDIVGMSRNRVTLVGEVKWTNRQMGVDVLSDLRTFKLPALAQDGYRFASDPQVVLISKSGFTKGLQEEAARDALLRLVGGADPLT